MLLSCLRNGVKMYLILFIVVLASLCFSDQCRNFNILPTYNANIAKYARLTVPQLITEFGYNGETHFITTEDGYIVQTHRISGGPNSPPAKGKKVCLFMHALMLSSSTFVISGPDHSLAFRLVDEGYDVWLGNVRGTIYSTNHTTYDPFGSRSDRRQFWRYSLHEIGYYDVPAHIDYILNYTGQAKLNYFGHSQGSNVFFIMASERPEYQSKIEMMHAVAPAVFLGNATSPPARTLSPMAKSLTSTGKMINFYSVFPTNVKICRDMKYANFICTRLFKKFVGDTDQMNSTLIPIIFGHNPNGASFDQLLHFGQLVNTGRFQNFDFGRKGNLAHYNSTKPPIYNLRNITVPVAVYHGKTDSLATIKDIQKLVAELPNVIKTYLVPHPKFSHIDFFWGKDVKHLFNDEIMTTLRSI